MSGAGGKPRRLPYVHTVDDDLADNDMTRDDLKHGAYSFRNVWGAFRKCGWHSRQGGKLSYDHFYCKPGKDPQHGVQNEDYFHGEAALVAYAIEIKLFGERELPSQAMQNGRETEDADDDVEDEDEDREDEDEEEYMESDGQDESASEVNSSEGAQEGKASVSAWVARGGPMRAAGSEQPHQAPGKRRRSDAEGSTSANAIVLDCCTDSSDADNANAETTFLPIKTEFNTEWAAAPANALETASSDDDFTMVNASRRPLLRTGVKRPAHSSPSAIHDASSTVSTSPVAATPKQTQSTSQRPGMRKRKSSPRGLLCSNDSSLESHGSLILDKTPSPVRSAVVRGRQSVVEPRSDDGDGVRGDAKATAQRNPKKARLSDHLKAEQEAAKRAGKPLPGGKRSANIKPEAAPRRDVVAKCPANKKKVIVDLVHVVFPSLPHEKYHVVVSATGVGNEKSIWIEEEATLVQRQCVFTTFRKQDGKQTTEVPDAAIFEALVRTLRALPGSETKPGAKVESTGSTDTTGLVDVIRSGTNKYTLQLTFPCYEFWQPRHTLSLKLVPTERRLQSVMEELATTKQQLRLLQRENEQLKQANQQLSQQYSRKPGGSHMASTSAFAASSVDEVELPLRAAPCTLHVLSKWMSTCARLGHHEHSSCIEWPTVVSRCDQYLSLEVPTSGAHHVEIRALVDGSFQLNLSVTHGSDSFLHVKVQSAHRPQLLSPTLMQLFDNKKRISRIDQIVEVRKHDVISVELDSRGTTPSANAMRWPTTFSPQPNVWMMTYLDRQPLYTDHGGAQSMFPH